MKAADFVVRQQLIQAGYDARVIKCRGELHEIFGSSRITGKDTLDLHEEKLAVSVSVCHPFDDLYSGLVTPMLDPKSTFFISLSVDHYFHSRRTMSSPIRKPVKGIPKKDKRYKIVADDRDENLS